MEIPRFIFLKEPKMHKKISSNNLQESLSLIFGLWKF